MKKLFVLLILAGQFASASIGVRGGGNMAADEFARTALSIVERMRASAIQDYNHQDISGNKLQDILAKMKVTAVRKNLVLNGVAVDAINDPAAVTVVINERKWERATDKEKELLVTHELLGLGYSAQFSDAGYIYSTEIIRQIPAASVRLLNIDCNAMSGHEGDVMSTKYLGRAHTTVYADASTVFEVGSLKIAAEFLKQYLKLTVTRADGSLVYKSWSNVTSQDMLMVEVPASANVGLLQVSCDMRGNLPVAN